MPQAHLVINLKITIIISHARLSEDFSTDDFPDNEKQNKSDLKIKYADTESKSINFIRIRSNAP